ncbi:MAG: hypothetical protein O3B13_21135, partial [Planctomycetota bacterium]|nr:hypothetical protein [Planctomycetota bacterium]
MSGRYSMASRWSMHEAVWLTRNLSENMNEANGSIEPRYEVRSNGDSFHGRQDSGLIITGDNFVTDRNPLTAICVATIVLMAISLTASASVPLELAVHEASRSARQKQFKEVLVIVRESSRSAKDDEIDGVLRAVEKMTLDMLEKEPEVQGVVDKGVRTEAAKSKARIPLRASDVSRFTSVRAADAVLSLDYRNRSGVSVEVTLLDGDSVYFSELVQLAERPKPIAEYLKDSSKDATEDKAADQESKDSDGKPAAKKDGGKSEGSSKGEVKLAPGSETIKGTGGKVRRSSVDTRNVRSTSRDQRQDASIKASTVTAAASESENKSAPRIPSAQISELQREVLNYAADNIGRKIGRGECWDLADQALRAAGAEP